MKIKSFIKSCFGSFKKKEKLEVKPIETKSIENKPIETKPEVKPQPYPEWW